MRKPDYSILVERVITENIVGTLKLWNGELLKVPEDARPDIVATQREKEKIYQFVTNEGRAISAKLVEKFTIDRSKSRTPLSEFEELVVRIINGETEGNVYFKDEIISHTSLLVGGIVGDKYYLVSDGKKVYYSEDFGKFEENEKPLA